MMFNFLVLLFFFALGVSGGPVNRVGPPQSEHWGAPEAGKEGPEHYHEIFNFLDNFLRRHETFTCKRDPSDRLPQNLAKVLETPRAYIGGPWSEELMEQQHVVIVGGGIAGLTAAYILLSVGQKVTILEGQSRIGGRIETYYGNGYYGELGAMRFPQCHQVLMKAFQLFDIETVPFTNTNEGSQGNYFHIDGKYITTEKLYTQNGLKDLYAIFDIPEAKIPRDKNGDIRNPVDVVQDIFDGELYKHEHCKRDQSLAAFLREKLTEKGYFDKIADVWATVTAQYAHMTTTVDEFLTSLDMAKLNGDCEEKTYLEVVNGSSVFPETIFKRLKSFSNFKIIMNTRVHRISDETDRVSIYHGDVKKPSKVVSDWVLVTSTAGAVDLIDFTKPLPYGKERALSNLKYFNSAKVFIKFKTPFWSRQENNMAEPILYGALNKNKIRQGLKMGGSGITDDHLKQIYYPSFDFHGPALLVSYTWNSDADFWLSLNDSSVKELVLKELSAIHGDVVRSEFEEMVVKRWIRDEFSHGAFVMHEPFQKYSYMDDLRSAYGNVYFSGEYTNKEYNGWIESAMESSIRVLVNKTPSKYDKEFLEGEMEFLERVNQKLSKYNHKM